MNEDQEFENFLRQFQPKKPKRLAITRRPPLVLVSVVLIVVGGFGVWISFRKPWSHAEVSQPGSSPSISVTGTDLILLSRFDEQQLNRYLDVEASRSLPDPRTGYGVLRELGAVEKDLPKDHSRGEQNR